MANLEFKVFHGVGAVIAEIKSDTLLSVLGYVDDNAFLDFSNTDLRFSVDMTRTPRRAGAWSKVLIDDRGIDSEGKELEPSVDAAKLPLCITSIGSGSSDDPMRGAFVGAVYLERSYFLSLRDTKLSGWPDKPGVLSLLEITSIAYSKSTDNGPRANKRYHGFPATVTGVSGNNVTVQIVETDATHKVTFTAKDTNAYDPAPPPEALGGEVSLANNLSVGQSGALFLELQTAVKAGLQGGKMPIGEL